LNLAAANKVHVRVSLVYNAGAGDGVSCDELRAAIEEAGHEVAHVLQKRPDPARAARDGVDLVVVGGGDGTVARAAIALAGHGLPLAILPLGTANNIARSLGLDGEPRALIAGWRRAHRRPLDLGEAVGAWGSDCFVEAVGAGLITEGIAAMDASPPGDDVAPDEALVQACRRYREVLADLKPRRCKLVVDGEIATRELLLVEVLNICSVGANIVLAADADPGDGRFRVVTAGEADRAALDAYLAARVDGRHAELALPARRARQVRLEGWDRLHVDDDVRDGDDAPVELGLRLAALELLV
jgi:diacylglycerol kinase (ATP)